MDFDYPPSAEELRAEVRAFLAARPVPTYPIDAMDGGYGFGAYSHRFMRALGERGWISLTWPARYGGAQRPMVDQLCLMETLALAGAPFGPRQLAVVDGVAMTEALWAGTLTASHAALTVLKSVQLFGVRFFAAVSVQVRYFR